MKLLTKKQVASQAAEIKRQEIQDGTELALRVQDLRKALADLQQQHKNFIEGSKRELERECSELFGQRESLSAEVASLTAVRDNLKQTIQETLSRIKS